MKLSARTLVGLLAAGVSLTAAQTAVAHGYLLNSRAHLCNTLKNANCGAIQWEPQSVEGGDRYPEGGPADGTIAAGGNPQWAPLSEQTRTRWTKTAVKAGPITFEWRFTAPHATRDIRYWITKTNWDPSQPITRAQFDPLPFCQATYNGSKPVPSTSETAKNACTLPARSGYHLVLSVWDVSDTPNSFYSVMDVNYDGGTPPSVTEIGKIQPSTGLPVGTTVATRLFDNNGELPALSASAKITTLTDGLANKWPRLLAVAVNAKNNGVQAGVLDAGTVTPADGVNTVYAANGSSVTRAEIATTLPPTDAAQEANFGLDKLAATPVVNGKAQLSAMLYTSVTQSVDVKVGGTVVYHADNMLGPKEITAPLAGVAPGEVDVAVIATFIKNGQSQAQQKSYKLVLTGSTSTIPVYPSGIGSYVEGSKVQGKDGRIYVCLGWPYTSWCNGSSAYYEPGVGSAWQNAWKLSTALR